MQVTSSKLTFNVKQDSPFNPSRFLINSQGFTLVELITSIAIIGILAAVGIQQYSQYKIRAYDSHSKQALRDMNLTCKSYWTDNGTSDECDLTKSKEYGFVQHPDVVAAIPSSAIDTFCASAKHNSSPNTFSTDSVGLISDDGDCGTGSADEEAAEDDGIGPVCRVVGECLCKHSFTAASPPPVIVECPDSCLDFCNFKSSNGSSIGFNAFLRLPATTEDCELFPESYRCR